MMNKKMPVISATLNILKLVSIAGCLAALPIFAQPDAPATADHLCDPTPAVPLKAIDTLADNFDVEGYSSLFDGTTFTGWWHDCQSGHTADKVNGAVWRVDPAQHALYSTQRGTNGGLLLSKRKHGNYEVMFDMWPSFGNDGGWFNRVPAGGACYQTVLDYITTGAFGATWGEGGYTGRDHRPFKFGANDSTITMGTPMTWTAFTATQNPASFGCPTTGCTQTEWRTLWNLYGWNQVKIRFYGGLVAGDSLHMKSWMRRDATKPWVPLWADALVHTDPVNYMGFQVHGGGRFGGAKGNWYRNIKWRPLLSNGDLAPVGINKGAVKLSNKVEINTIENGISIHALTDFNATIVDLNGKVLENFSGKAGNSERTFVTKQTGRLFVDIKTANGVERQQIVRLPN